MKYALRLLVGVFGGFAPLIVCAETLYGYISNVDPSEYLTMMENVVDCQTVSDIRDSILKREDLTIEQKTQLVEAVGAQFGKNLDAELSRQTTKIIAEGVVGAAVQIGGAYIPGWAGGALDGLGQAIIDGEWQEIDKVAAKMSAGAATSAVTPAILKKAGRLTSNVINSKVVKEVSEQVAAKVDELASKTIKEMAEGITGRVRDSIDVASGKVKMSNLTYALSDAYLEVNTKLLPKLKAVQAEIATKSKELSRAVSKSEIDKLNKEIKELTDKAGELQNKISSTNAEIDQIQKGIDAISKSMERTKTLADNLTANIVSKVEVEGYSIDGIANDLSTAVVSGVQSAFSNVYNGSSENLVLTGRVEENVYVDPETGDILPLGERLLQDDSRYETSNSGGTVNPLVDTFDTLPSETRETSDIVLEELAKQFGEILKDADGNPIVDADGKSIVEKAVELVKEKIGEVVAKGEEWIENGGIRDLLKKQLDKMLDGKVPDADRQRILNMADSVCNLPKDGGKSFLEVLGTDGKDLAVSLAINELKKQISKALPQDEADLINSMIDTLAKDIGSADLKGDLLANVQEYIKNKLPNGYSADAINEILQQIADGKAVDAFDSILNVGKAVAIDKLKEAINKALGPEAAQHLNAVIDGFMQNGLAGMTEAGFAELLSYIDQHAPTQAIANSLKKIITGMKDGTLTLDDLRTSTTDVLTDSAHRLIDQANIPDEVKELMHRTIDELRENGIDGIDEIARNYLHDYVEEHLGEEAAEAVDDIFDSFLDPSKDPWDAVRENAATIGGAIAKKVLAKIEKSVTAQIDKLIAKHPALKAVFDKLGINGASIVQGIKNILNVLQNAESLKDAITKLSQLAVSALKDLAAKLISWAAEWAISWINNKLIPKVVNWVSEKLGKLADAAGNKYVKMGLLWLKAQVERNGSKIKIKVKIDNLGVKVVDKIENMIKKKTEKKQRVIMEGSTP